MSERRIGDDVETASWKPQFGDVRAHHLDGVLVGEFSGQLRCTPGMQLEREDVRSTLDQETGDDTVTCAEIEDQVTCSEAGRVDERTGEFVSEPIPTPRLSIRCPLVPGHDEPSQ